MKIASRVLVDDACSGSSDISQSEIFVAAPSPKCTRWLIGNLLAQRAVRALHRPDRGCDPYGEGRNGHGGGGRIEEVLNGFDYFTGLERFVNCIVRVMPSPSFTKINWFAFTSFRVSTWPLGQRISSMSTLSAFPSPKWTRRSL